MSAEFFLHGPDGPPVDTGVTRAEFDAAREQLIALIPSPQPIADQIAARIAEGGTR